MTHFSAAQRRPRGSMTVSGVQAVGVMGAILRGGGAVQSWVKPTKAPGGAEEAHRRWPRGRSEHGREKGKGLPSKGLRAAARFVSWEGSSSSHDPFFSRAAASEGSMTVSGVQAVGVVGAILRGGGAVQSWVKPEVDPPSVCALPRGSYLGEGSSSSHDPFFSRAAASEGSMTVSGVQAAGVMGATRRGGGAVQSWVKPTEAPGGAEEAHRRWPRGRSEQGREQGKG